METVHLYVLTGNSACTSQRDTTTLQQIHIASTIDNKTHICIFFMLALINLA